MKAAIIIETGMKVFIHEGKTPSHSWNSDKVVVSKQPNSACVFSIELEKLEII